MASAIGTIPALPPYKPGALPIASTVNIEIVDSISATTALSWRMTQGDFVGKAPSVLSPGIPSVNDLLTVLASTNIPFACTVGNLSLAAAGNLPTGGNTGTILSKNSTVSYDASWTPISSHLSAGTSVTLAGSTTVVVGVTNFGIDSGQIATFAVGSPQIATNAVGNIQFRQGPAVSIVGVAGAATSNVADIISSVGTAVLISNAANDSIAFGPLTTAYLPRGTTGMFLQANGNVTPPGYALVDLSMATNVTGTATIVVGGTGTNVLQPFGVMLGGTTVVSVVPPANATAGFSLRATGTATAPAWGLVNLSMATNVTGTATIVVGGTGTNVLLPFGVVLGGTTTVSVVLPSTATAGMSLQATGSASAPSWSLVNLGLSTNVTGTATIVVGGTGTNVLQPFGVVLGGTTVVSVVPPSTATAGFNLVAAGSAAAPTWAGSGGVLLNTLTASQIASAVDTTSLTSKYSRYRITFQNVCPVATATLTCSLNMVVATNGVNWLVANYISTLMGNAVTTTFIIGTTSNFYLSGITATTCVGTSTGYGVNGWVEITNPSNGVFQKFIQGQLSYLTPGGVSTLTNANVFPGGWWDGGTSAITGVAIAFQTGNIATGTFRIYGIS